jgi:hypothetical protein
MMQMAKEGLPDMTIKSQNAVDPSHWRLLSLPCLHCHSVVLPGLGQVEEGEAVLVILTESPGLADSLEVAEVLMVLRGLQKVAEVVLQERTRAVEVEQRVLKEVEEAQKGLKMEVVAEEVPGVQESWIVDEVEGLAVVQDSKRMVEAVEEQAVVVLDLRTVEAAEEERQVAQQYLLSLLWEVVGVAFRPPDLL